MIITVLFFINVDNALWILVSFSTSKNDVASSKRITFASLSNALAIDILCLWPPDNSSPFSPMTVPYPSGSFWTNSSHSASFAASITSSSVASFFPTLMFSNIVLLNRITSWKTIEKFSKSFSESSLDKSCPPKLTLPETGSQNLAASFETVDLPPPEGPTSAVTSPWRAVKLISVKTSFKSS